MYTQGTKAPEHCLCGTSVAVIGVFSQTVLPYSRNPHALMFCCLEELYEVKENIDSVNSVSTLVISGTRTDGIQSNNSSEKSEYKIKL